MRPFYIESLFYVMRVNKYIENVKNVSTLHRQRVIGRTQTFATFGQERTDSLDKKWQKQSPEIK